ncbi:SET domain [Phytophthora cactorum]|nr:SET domain [Phytophthora cactorum]
MSVGGTEVIDARYNGKMARFANHSCRPNCVVERWEVQGKTCIGYLQLKIFRLATRLLSITEPVRSVLRKGCRVLATRKDVEGTFQNRREGRPSTSRDRAI